MYNVPPHQGCGLWQAATELQALNATLHFGAIDATANKKLADEYSIPGYPTIKVLSCSQSHSIPEGTALLRWQHCRSICSLLFFLLEQVFPGRGIVPYNYEVCCPTRCSKPLITMCPTIMAFNLATSVFCLRVSAA